MKHKILIIFIIFVCFFINIDSLEAASKYHFGYTKGLEVKIVPDSYEIIAGSVATFTVTLTNKNKYGISVEYPTGRQWDMVVYSGNSQIFRWSDGFTWRKSPHSVPLAPGESRSQKLSWVAVNRNGDPLFQGIYKCVGLVTCSPRTLVSNEVRIRLTPPSIITKEIIYAKLNKCFEIELPRFANNQELVWDIIYVNNDNRIDAINRRVNQNSIVITFKPKRYGHVEFSLYAHSDSLKQTKSLERRSYRIEVE